MKFTLHFPDKIGNARGEAFTHGSALPPTHGPTPSVRRVDQLSEEAAQAGDPSPEVQARIEAAVLKIARLIGRQIAREEFQKRLAQAATDNSHDTTKR